MNHPITPPPELVQQWARESARAYEGDETWIDLATQAARWGADAELEACCKVLEEDLCCFVVDDLRAARRPKPPSLAEQALERLTWIDEKLEAPLFNHCNAIHTIRAALDRLKELEQSDD